MVGNECDVIIFNREYPDLAKDFSAALGDTGHAWLNSEKGIESHISLMQIDGGRDASYVVAVNDSWVATQADWHQVKETLTPRKADGFLYDCTDEKPLGQLKPFACDLSRTTARVFAALPRELKGIAVSATQSIAAGNDLAVTVEFQDAKGGRLVGVLPFHLTFRRPDGSPQAEFYPKLRTWEPFFGSSGGPSIISADAATRGSANGRVVKTLPLSFPFRMSDLRSISVTECFDVPAKL